MNGPYPEITNISFLAKLFFKTFISLKHLSDYRTVGLSDRRAIGLSDYSYGPISHNFILLYQIIIFPGQGSCVHIARYVHVALCGLSDLDSGGCLIINYNVPAILLYKYINSYRYIL